MMYKMWMRSGRIVGASIAANVNVAIATVVGSIPAYIPT